MVPRHAVMNTAKQLLDRFHKVLAEWPVDASRKGRDLGAYLREQYSQKLSKVCHIDPARASNAVLCLERLNSNYYRGLYRRKKELGFCGEIVAQNSWLLSTDHLNKMEAESKGWWKKLTSRRS